jgi:beta-galactosidase
MHLGTQYYRAPFPNRKYWDDDLKNMKDAGLDTVQLWVLWGWVEATPGQFRYDDYDELMELADKHGLNVVLSTIGEIQPVWIHRLIPDSHLVDHRGWRVLSCNRRETHFGLSPGGCRDNDEVWKRMEAFLQATADRYRQAPPLLGWDAWNELRWNVMAGPVTGGLTCFCEHTIAKWRAWLEERYGGLDGLNEAWEHRYVAWEDVLPGRVAEEPYTHHMSFAEFTSWRSGDHGRQRYEAIKAVDPDHPVTVHAAEPCVTMAGSRSNHPVNRGNDWDLAEHLDGIGCSSFPKWGVDVRSNWSDFVDRISAVRSAARGKAIWLSEVQGGRASVGFDLLDPVDPASQQSWVWIGQACGADVMLLWCWRDEVFGRESNGFGISGRDGFAQQRMAAMRRTAAVMSEHRDLLDAYEPAPARVGLWFSPRTYYLAWAQEGRAHRISTSLQEWAAALTGESIPYRIVEERYLDALDELEVLFLPRNWAMDASAEDALRQWVRAGGTLVCESEVGAFDERGIYRYPPGRMVAQLTGADEIGRRQPTGETLRIDVPGCGRFEPRVSQWITPTRPVGQVWADHPEGALAQEIAVDDGHVILLGSYLSRGETTAERDAFDGLVTAIARRCGIGPAARFEAPVAGEAHAPYFRHGRSGERDVLVAFTPPSLRHATLRLTEESLLGGEVSELLAGGPVEIVRRGDDRLARFTPSEWGISVLVS